MSLTEWAVRGMVSDLAVCVVLTLGWLLVVYAVWFGRD